MESPTTAVLPAVVLYSRFIDKMRRKKDPEGKIAFHPPSNVGSPPAPPSQHFSTAFHKNIPASCDEQP